MRVLTCLVLVGLPAVIAQSTSKTGRCGSQFGLTCRGSAFGDCCSQYNYCGSTAAYCGTGCQTGYGTCTSNGGGSTKVVSKDGRCGGAKGQTCLGSAFGDCCSQYDYCGSSNAYCGTGCNPSFGTCNTTPSSSRSVVPTSARSSAPSPSATQKVSKNARCGPQFGGQTCLSSQWGDCCSQYSYCGSTSGYCGTGCQAGFGKCNSISSSVRSFTTQASSSSQSPTPSPSSISSSASASSSLSASQSSIISSSAASSSVSSVISSSTPVPVSSSSAFPSSSVAATSFSESSSTAISSSSSMSSDVVGPSVSSPTPIGTLFTSSSVMASSSSDIVSSTSSSSAGSSSAASSTVSSSSADTTSSTAVSSSSSSVAASSSAAPTFGCPAPAPTAAILPTNFCLKVVTPGIASTGYAIKLSGTNVLVVRRLSEATFPVAFFNLESSGQLVTTAGSRAVTTGPLPNGQVQVIGPQDNTAGVIVTETSCDVGAGNILQCASCGNGFSRNIFRTMSPPGSFVNDILRLDEQSTRPGFFTLEFGIFTGTACA